VTFISWSIDSVSAPLIVGPRKINTNYLRQTFGEQYLEYVIAFEFSKKKAGLSDALAIIQTQKYWLQASDVITYPLIQETFAFVESNLESRIDRQYLELDFVRNKSEKDVAKIVSFTIMRFPR